MHVFRALLGLVFFALPAAGQGVAELNDRGLAAYRAGEPDKALAAFRAALVLDPESAVLRENAARCALDLGDRSLRAERLREARQHYRAAGDLQPNASAPKVREALACLAAQQPAEAESLLRPHAEHSHSPELHEVLGRALLARGDARAAVASLERARELAAPRSAQRARVEERLLGARREATASAGMSAVDRSAMHFEVRYSGVGAAAGSGLGALLENVYERVGALTGRYPKLQVPVVVYPRADGLARASGAHRWIGGLYDGRIRVTEDALRAAPGEAQRLLAHEYTHALLHSVGGARVPVWLQEGLAQLAEGSGLPPTPRRGAAPTLAQLRVSFSGSSETEARERYAAAAHFVRYLHTRGGMPLLIDVVERVGRQVTPAQAVQGVYGASTEELYAEWEATLR